MSCSALHGIHQEDHTFNKIGFSLLKSKFVSSSCPKRLGNENSGTFFPTRGLESFDVSLFKEKNKNILNNIIKTKGKNFKWLLFNETSDSYRSRYNPTNDYH